MSHHRSDGTFEEFKKMIMSEPALEKVLQGLMGPTDRHPEPALGKHDEGEIQFRVGTMRDKAGKLKIIVDFGSPVHSLGMTKSEACELGRLLINRAGYTCTVHLD